jgi:hypothetical protein
MYRDVDTKEAGWMSQELWWAFGISAAACLWLAVAAVLAARRPVEPRVVDAWASGHGLPALPVGQRQVAERYLHRSRLLRTVGGAVPFVAGTVLYGLWAATRGLPAPWPLGLFGARSWLAGYLVGVLVAEWSWARPQAGPVRAAALVPRHLGNYLPGRVMVGLRLAGLAVAALVPLLAWGPVVPAPVRALVLWGRGGAVATAAVAVGVTLAVEALLRRMAGRPQPAPDPTALAVDDALRSTSVHAAAGAGLAIVLLSLSLQVSNVAANLGPGPGRTATVGLAWGCALAALALWARIGHPHRPARAGARQPARA